MPGSQDIQAGEGRRKSSEGASMLGMGPVLLSAVVFPGVGQCVQRRWVAAGFHAIAFGVAFGCFLARCFAILKMYYSLAFDFEHAVVEPPSLNLVLFPLLACVVLYVANLVDVAMAGRRRPLRRGGDPIVPPCP